MRPEGRRGRGSRGVSPRAGVVRLGGMRPVVLLRAVTLLVLGGLGAPVDLPAQAAKKPATVTTRSSARSTGRSTTSRRSSTRRRSSRPTIRAGKPIGVDSLVAHLGRVLRAAANGRWGAIVVSAETGDTLFARDADGSFLPASTMKLYTAAVALDRFGPQHQFQTEVLRNGPILVDGTIDGDLILRGAGDPTLGLDGPAANALDALAAQVADAGIRVVRGDVLGDASAFEARRVPEGWKPANLRTRFAPRVSALSLASNMTSVVVRPSGRQAVVSLGGQQEGVPVRSSVTVRQGSRSAAIRVRHDTLTGRVNVSGWIGSRSRARSYRLMIETPETFAAAAFRTALERRGIEVLGESKAGAAPLTAQPVTAWASQPLERLVAHMNEDSDNHFAELIFRNAARTAGTVGSAAEADAALREFLSAQVGVPRDAVSARDGSGLSTLDRVTPRSMVQLLAYAPRTPWGESFRNSLPIAGRTGTLAGRMRGTAAQDNVRAKTGTTGSVISLGGYVKTRDREELVFSFIYNGTSLTRARVAIDAMSVTLANFSRAGADGN